ncbi:DUF2975 domain-containing protein [Allobacillus halotolerans]|uniref:DUF2975 domain-containing protein n=1 Tax=Allobacillus halotolerans TaxID=570278 RepID=A0ABS6GSY1_9BACI|nr:DUF2975 domain-containing protein [Allobacillus halotolerans]MBU6081774.1 DUF2975 domain-containing protein [Allobacillus halotolerans]
MKRGTTFFLKTTVFLIGIMILLLSAFFLPWLASYTASMYPEFAYLQYPVLIGMYVTAIPFFFALYQALKLLNYIDHGKAFTDQSLEALNSIKYCAILISGLYVIGTIFLISQSSLHPSVAIIGFIIIFTSVVIAVFAAVLQKLFKNALVIKSENDLTV